jgi:hypothetical protein
MFQANILENTDNSISTFVFLVIKPCGIVYRYKRLLERTASTFRAEYVRSMLVFTYKSSVTTQMTNTDILAVVRI